MNMAGRISGEVEESIRPRDSIIVAILHVEQREAAADFFRFGERGKPLA
ncbi:MAG TPA: hypothetical protein VIG51_02325 [Candidatus Baltobacteraceae bacterium]